MAKKSPNEPENKAALRLGQFLAERGLNPEDEKDKAKNKEEKQSSDCPPPKKANSPKEKTGKKNNEKSK